MPGSDGRDSRRWLGASRPRALLAGMMALAFAWTVSAAGPPAATSYRIFLTDGTPLVSFGEFARANGRVVFTVPIGEPSNPDILRVVTLPDTVVDWERTNRYNDAVRHQRYAAARGEDDYAALTGAVARALGDMAFARDAGAKLAIAADIRRQLLEWPDLHHGYRAGDVRELTAIVEEAVSDIRAISGRRDFDLSLVAMIEPPPESLLPEPTLTDSISLAATIAERADSRPDRMSLQQSILSVLDRRKRSLPRAWFTSTRRFLAWSLERETTLDKEYSELASHALRAAAESSARGDVEKLERLTATVRNADGRLGYERPQEMQALLASLATSTEAARTLRIAIDRWKQRHADYDVYDHRITASLEKCADVTVDMNAVKTLSGLGLKRLSKTDKRVSAIEASLRPLDPPAELRPAHDMLLSSVRLMREAIRLQRGAALAGDVNLAQNASAAAAGALLLLDTARRHVDEFFHRPLTP